ncbi:hypothetical protein TrLO_g9534 [Triparma laevis f. longispina]|uniref:Uncharacterized protein n=1 Tax=Triparma laevis f. longispina TaxID=1714387 RepID=A0A9W7F3W1_9STRA|nr:hypothetical protein TrLO_g9534 [Triparma laevis f. longispina]
MPRFLIFLLLAIFLTTSGQKENRGRILTPGLAVPGSDGKIAKWPETIGMEGIEAAEYIQNSRPDLATVTVIGERDIMTRDMRFDRVRIFVDENGEVIKCPRIG